MIFFYNIVAFIKKIEYYDIRKRIGHDYNENKLGNNYPVFYSYIPSWIEPSPNASFNLQYNNGTYNLMYDGVDSYSDCDFGQETITVRFKNISDNTIPANSVTMNYKVENSTVKTGTVSHSIEPNVEYDFNFTQTFDFSAPTQDMERELKAWSSFSLDTIKSNDTTIARVFSSHQIPARADMSISVPYGTTATLSVTSNDSVYWFYTLDDAEPFLKSQSLQTTVRKTIFCHCFQVGA